MISVYWGKAMNKVHLRLVIFLALVATFISAPALAQTITIRPIEAGPYGRGSSIGIPVLLDKTVCIPRNNVFRLFLSDANGSFAAQTEIGVTIESHYTSYINGVIPVNAAAGTNYRVKVTAGASEAISQPFEIRAQLGVGIRVSSDKWLRKSPNEPGAVDVFGLCNGVDQQVFKLTNTTPGTPSISATVFNETDNTAAGNLTLAVNVEVPFKATTVNYTITTKAVTNGIISTKCYPLVNNIPYNGLLPLSDNRMCLSDTKSIDFKMPYLDIQRAYPGNYFNVDFGDQSGIITLTPCQIIAAKGIISHKYTESSCERTSEGVGKGAFRASMQAYNPYCSTIGTISNTPVIVLAPGVNLFRMPATSCAGKEVTFVNDSYPGQVLGNEDVSCKNRNPKYTWDFGDPTDPNNKLTGQRLNATITHSYKRPGQYTVTLTLEPDPNDLCEVDVYKLPICIVEAPKPNFTMPEKGCVNTIISTTDQSVISPSTCTNVAPVYRWSSTSPGFAFAPGSTAADKSPKFTFSRAGVYKITLGITRGCEEIQITKNIIINAEATATLSPDATFCQVNIDIPFNPTALKTKTTLTGTEEDESPNFEWSVISPAGVPAPDITPSNHARYPVIKFKGAGVYTVRIRHKNDCGNTTVDRSQKITLRDAPEFNPVASPALLCPTATADLNANIEAGSYTSLKWTSTDPQGEFRGGDNIINPVYKPSAAEIAAGIAHITLNVFTDITGCETLEPKTIDIVIQPVNDITTPNTVVLCTGANLNYNIDSPAPNSTYTWTIISISPFITGATESANGSKKSITDKLVSSNLTENGTVVYRILPINGNCTGTPFDLTVTVAPNVIANFEVAGNNFGCGDTEIEFKNTSTPTSNVTYLWSFGDNETSTDASPKHIFKQITDGSGNDVPYKVRLTVTNACGEKTTADQEIIIHPAVPLARIGVPNPSADCGKVDRITVTNTSPGNNRSYTFTLTDGKGNQIKPPIVKTDKSDAVFTDVVPTKTEPYFVNMIVENLCGTKAPIPAPRRVDVAVAGQSDMEISVPEQCAGVPVQFKNSSIGSTFRFDISLDGKIIDTRTTNVMGDYQYTFADAGTYTVTVTATSNGCGEAPPSGPRTIKIYGKPSALFTPKVVNCNNLVYK
ncbi:MAG: PKD domain-containing protein, partial [Sphingobacteriaceae bacterium]